jgi:hypothetical protein
MISDSQVIDSGLDDLLNRHFPGKVVRKDLTKLVKEGANVPVYVLEYLLGSYCASNDEVVIAEGLRTVKKILAENYVRPDEAEKVKSTIRERGSLKVIDKVTVTLNEKRDVYEAVLGNLGVSKIVVPSSVVKKFEKIQRGGHVADRGLRSLPIPCRFASQAGSLYESHVWPEASCQTSALNGRSSPIVWTEFIKGVPPLALPKIRTSVGRSDSPTAVAPAA